MSDDDSADTDCEKVAFVEYRFPLLSSTILIVDAVELKIQRNIPNDLSGAQYLWSFKEFDQQKR